MINILIPEEVPSLNKGEEAILIGMVESFKILREDFAVSLFSLDPDTDEARYGSRVRIIDARGIMPQGIMFRSRSRILKIFEYLAFVLKHLGFVILFHLLGRRVMQVMRRDVWSKYYYADLVVLGHDSAFTDVYHSILIFFFKLLGKKVVIYGATLPFVAGRNSRFWRLIYSHLVRSALNRSDLITLREKISYECLKKMGIDRKIFHLTGDFAFLAPGASDQEVAAIMEKEGLTTDDGPIIGMTVSANKIRFTSPDISDPEERRRRFVAVMVKVVDYLSTSLGATVVFVPHSIVYTDNFRDDRVIASEILQHVRNRSHVKVITNEYSAEELKGLEAKFAFCIGSRLHFIVDAMSMLVPSIAVTNKSDYRTHGIIGGMLGQRKWVYDVDELKYENLVGLIEEGWTSRNEIVVGLRQAMEKNMALTAKNGELLRKLFIREGAMK